MASTVLPNGIIIPEKFSRDWYADLYHNWQELDNLLGGGTPKDGTLTIQKNGATVGTFSANQATNETINITVPDVNDATLTIQKNGTTVDTFTANSSTDKTVNISVPTKTSDLTNDSNFVPSTDLATVATSGNYNDLSNKPTIPTVNDATLTIQKNGTTIDTFTANSSTDKTVNISVPTNTSELTNGAGFITADYAIPRSGGAVMSGTILAKTTDNSYITFCGSTNLDNGAYVRAYGKDYSDSLRAGTILIRARDNSNVNFDLVLKSDGTATWGSKNLAMQEDVVPRSGGNVFNSNDFGRNSVQSYLQFTGGDITKSNGRIALYGGEQANHAGEVLISASNPTLSKYMWIKPNGTWTWDGQAVQLISDQRLKQQITEIDDKLLDAWEDVELVQFKYNDAVDQKKDKARLHTGYVVQQIDEACKSHNVDISKYGLYCHEVYPEETEEVEVEQKDGTKTKERKVIREANEHYSLRYTEALIVECKYLRRCIERLTARIEELEKENNTK